MAVRGFEVLEIGPFQVPLNQDTPREGSSLLAILRKAACPMYSSAILHEFQQLYDVSDRLDLLAEQHPLVSDALVTISGSVRNTATLLEVLVAMKMVPIHGLDPASA